MNEVIEKCKAALAQPAKRPWVGLTTEQIYNEVISKELDFVQGFAQGAGWAEATLKEQNT